MKQRVFTLLLCIGASLAIVSARPKVGLVLGGGGAKGAAEIGALKVIEQSKVPIDYIAGTSIGSIIGGLYSCGYRSADLDSLFRNQDWARTFGDDILKGDDIEELFKTLTKLPDSIDFDKLPIPFRCVAVDLNGDSVVVFHKGSLTLAMRASMSIPAAFKPVRINGKLLVDGGMKNNLPVDVVKAMGADYVIAVDLTQNKRKEKKFSLKEKTGIGGILDYLISRPDLKTYYENVKMADIYINPDLKGFSAASFNSKAISEMIERGYEAALDKQDELVKLRKHVLKHSSKTSRHKKRR